MKDYTTIEQGKRLLELGVPANSANFYWDCLYDGDDKFWKYENRPTMIVNDWEWDTQDSAEEIVPCWSVGQLIRIYLQSYVGLISTNYTFEVDDANNILEIVIERLQKYSYKLDFSKVEAYDAH